MIGFLLGLLDPIGKIADRLQEAYVAKLRAENDEQRIRADIEIETLKAKRDILLAEQKSWMTRWIRPFIAAPVGIYVWKLLVWDNVLGLGATPQPSDIVQWIVVTVIGAFFIGRPLEKLFGRK